MKPEYYPSSFILSDATVITSALVMFGVFSLN